MSDLDDFKATYFDECSELLTELEEQFAAIEEGERGSDRLNAVFRAIHSIKGGAGAFGFSALVGFAHAYETLLDYVRDGRVELTDDVVVLCIRANDIVADHVNAAQSGEALPADYGAEEKARFESTRMVHTIEASQRLHNPNPTPEEVEIWRKRPAKVHPLIWRHESGRRSLVIGATVQGVDGMDEAEGAALHQELLERSTRPDRVYRHEWQVGDMVIWDNRGVLHRACPYPVDSPRDMHRTTLSGDEAIQ